MDVSESSQQKRAMGVARETTVGRFPPSAHPERRRSPRRPHVAAAFLSSPTGGTPVDVVCSDVSRHGICLILPRAIPGGTYHRLEPATGSDAPAREVRILSCTKLPDGKFQAHAEFA